MSFKSLGRGEEVHREETKRRGRVSTTQPQSASGPGAQAYHFPPLPNPYLNATKSLRVRNQPCEELRSEVGRRLLLLLLLLLPTLACLPFPSPSQVVAGQTSPPDQVYARTGASETPGLPPSAWGLEDRRRAAPNGTV